MNDLQKYAGIFDDLAPFAGVVPAGFIVNFLGMRTSKDFLGAWGYPDKFVDGAELRIPRPSLADNPGADFWFEVANWVLSAREARDRYVMVTLGALYGTQAIGACQVLQRLNPLPYKLVAVEPVPQNMEWCARHMGDNGIDPDEQWLIQAAIGADNEPAFFPVGAPGLGAQNCVSTNTEKARKQYLAQCIAQGRSKEVLKNLLLHNSTGLQHQFIKDKDFFGEVRLVSTVTLKDVLGPFEKVDLVESDLQESEILVFPAFRPLLKRKVHRIHIATHGKDVHRSLLQMFVEDGWNIVFSYEPDDVHETVLGTFSTNDGVLSVHNPDV